MTLIAQFGINGAPLLVGDVLLSSETTAGLRVTLPLVGDINEVLAKNGQPFRVNFAQKLNVLSDKLVVAWSGPKKQAERALRVLSRTRANVELEEIEHELCSIDRQAIDKLQLIGVLLGEVQGSMRAAHCFVLGVRPTNVANIGAVFAAGTGQEAFLRLLEKANWTNSGTGNEFQVAHALLGALTNEEYRTGSTIWNRWGGGFEAVTCPSVTGRFEKVGDVLHTFWRMIEDASDPLQFTPIFYKTTYWRDALVIRSAHFEERRMNTFEMVSNDMVLIPPLLKEIEDYDLREFGPGDFGYRAICCHVLIHKSDGADIMLFVEQHDSQPGLEFDLYTHPGRLHISSSLIDGIIDQARRR